MWGWEEVWVRALEVGGKLIKGELGKREEIEWGS